MAPWSAPEHLRKPRSSGDSTRKVDASDVPVWIEADEVRAFRVWWNPCLRHSASYVPINCHWQPDVQHVRALAIAMQPRAES